MSTIEVISIVSPFVSATLTAFITYRFTVQSKRFDILYANKMPAFKEVTSEIVAFKNFCTGRVAYFQGNEYAAFYEEGLGALRHRTEIAKILESNSIFLSEASRRLVSDLIGQMSELCNAEATISGGDNTVNPTNEYARMIPLSESLIEVLYKELNLIKQ